MQKKQSFDQLGRLVEFSFPPQRIISLVPSQTELLFDLGLNERVIGITKFCIHPKEQHQAKLKVGGTKNFDVKVIEELKPDLIIGNKEENDEERIKLLSTKFPVWMSDVVSWDSAMEMILKIGEIVDEELKSNSLVASIENDFKTLKKFSPHKTLYLIWKKPWMTAGRNTFIDVILKKIGLTNIIFNERYPELSIDEIKSLSPELVLLSSEPFPFAEKHIHELQEVLPNSKIVLVDGEMFSWYRSRLLKAPEYLNSLPF
ncbi:MAG: helical backbone metal receptor [Cyclobacteriaceae bacterium]